MITLIPCFESCRERQFYRNSLVLGMSWCISCFYVVWELSARSHSNSYIFYEVANSYYFVRPHLNKFIRFLLNRMYFRVANLYEFVRMTRVGRFSQQNPPNCYSKLAQSSPIAFQGDPLVKIVFRGVKYTLLVSPQPADMKNIPRKEC